MVLYRIENVMKYLIYGAGNTGFAAHILLKSKGFDSVIYTRSSEKKQYYKANKLTVDGKLAGQYDVEISDDLASAMRQCDAVIVSTWANAHADAFTQIKPFLKRDMLVIILNGNWGGYQAVEIFAEQIEQKHIVVAETASQPLFGQLKDNHLKFANIKKNIACACYPERAAERFSAVMRQLFAEVSLAESIMLTSFSSTNPVVHVPICMTNLTAIEKKAAQFFYLEGASCSNVNLIEALDRERIDLAAHFGFSCPSVLQSLNTTWGTSYQDLLTALVDLYPTAKFPADLKHRYFAEDIAFGLAAVINLAKTQSIATPVSDATLALYEVLIGQKYSEMGIDFKEVVVKKIIA